MTVAIWLMILSCWLILMGIFYSVHKIQNSLTDKSKHDKTKEKDKNE